jgi:hypothetical protein
MLLWLAALVVTVALAAFQRGTGPSYPLRGTVVIDGQAHRYSLPRTHGGAGGLEVSVALPAGVDGTLLWRRYPTSDPWQALPMVRERQGLVTTIPHQPPAGKVEYRIELAAAAEQVVIPAVEAAVARFRADVPAAVLVPHILAMFCSMLLSTRALLEVLRHRDAGHRLVVLAMAVLVVGGLILGPIVQQHAFGAYWTGWPNGTDLTDNKTLLAFLAWLPATVLALRRRRLRVAVALGWVVMMGVFLVPHSMHGSEIDWEDQATGTGASSLPRAAPG